MLKGFICPDGETIEKEACFKTCRMASRCLTLSTLRKIGEERKWDGKASVTQLLNNGPRYTYLTTNTDYFIDPKAQGFRLLGTRVHASLDDIDDLAITEQKLDDAEIKGTFDNYEDKTLTDYKVVGSYKVALALGLEPHKEPIPGEVYKISGTWGQKGSPKMRTVFKPTGTPQMFEWEMQLNKYRIMFQKKMNLPVERLQIEIIVRDGGTQTAVNRGIDYQNNIFLVDVPIKDEKEVDEWFSKRNEELLKTMNLSESPRLCDERESWGGTRCQYYCSVKEACLQFKDNIWLEENSNELGKSKRTK